MKTKKNKLPMALLSCAAMAACTPSLHAATSLLDNTSAGVRQGSGAGVGGAIVGGLAFSTGSQAYSLDSIEFAPRGFSAGNLTLSLYSADASTHLPTTTTALASETFSNVYTGYSSTATPKQVTFTNNFTLEANSSYVLAFSAPDVMSAIMTNATSGTPISVGTSGLTYDGYTFKNESWSNPNPTYLPYLKLTGTATDGTPPAGGGTSAVPEASTSLGLLALGAGGLLTRRRQKRAA